MKSHPYLGISDRVVDVAKPLLNNSGEYHMSHRARLARTAEILTGLVEEAGENCRILELGTSGFIPVFLKSLFPSVTIDVTDYSGDRKEGVRQRDVSVAGQSALVDAFTVDLEYDTLPVDDETYDIVICCEVLEHMEIDPMFMLAEVNRVIKTNGKLLLTTPNVLSTRSFRKMIEGYPPYFFMQYHKTREYHRHNYEYSAKVLWSTLRCAGFDPTVWTEDLFEDSQPHTVDSLNYFGFKIANVGDNLIAVAPKISGVVERYPNGLYV
jgi:ubiquinone/menaquinone biosynthesis C-methylase UbiE